MVNYSINNFSNIIDISQNNILYIMTYIFCILLVVLGFISVLAMFLVYVERKVAAAFQCRLGPNRAGWKGILQSIADALKLLTKEKITPLYADKLLHFMAPIICLGGAFISLLIIPFSPTVQIINLNIGILYWSAISSLGILGVLIAGWSSYNKWSLLSSIRSASQLISYELSIILSIIVVVIFANTLNMQKIVLSQMEGWWIWRGHISTFVAFVVFFIASLAELNKLPFDLPEGESELGAGFHTEYSGMQFAFFFLSEYINLFISCSIMTVLFFGGWLPIYIKNCPNFNKFMNELSPLLCFFLKAFTFVFLIMWVRWTVPRLRIDQLIELEWKFLLPVSLVNVILASIFVLYELYLF